MFGGLAIAGLVIGKYRQRKYREKILAADQWTFEEEAKLRAAFEKTHDFEELCKEVPGRSRESVAVRTKLLLETKQPFFYSLAVVPKEGYTFITERTRRVAQSFSRKFNAAKGPSPSSFQSKFSSKQNQKKSGSSFQRGSSFERIAENPLYFTGY